MVGLEMEELESFIHNQGSRNHNNDDSNKKNKRKKPGGQFKKLLNNQSSDNAKSQKLIIAFVVIALIGILAHVHSSLKKSNSGGLGAFSLDGDDDMIGGSFDGTYDFSKNGAAGSENKDNEPSTGTPPADNPSPSDLDAAAQPEETTSTNTMTDSSETTSTTTDSSETAETTTTTESDATETIEESKTVEGRKYSDMATVVPNKYRSDLTEDERSELSDKWGKWHFWDGDEDERPEEDYCADYPNRDIPGDDFPDEAWQLDAVFVNHLLNDADDLISRAQEAIYTEYGHGKPLPAAGFAERRKMFHWDRIKLEEEDKPPEKFQKHGNRGNGGWTTERSFDGLVRRILHAILTRDTFTIVMAGHSAAMGEGNHFHQSYMMQMHEILYPIFARLGVKLITRNMAQGGLGTVHSSLGSSSIYGDQVDLLIWDSGMTENPNPDHVELFMRQGLIGSKRIPVVWGGHFNILRHLHNEADVDVGEFGWGMDGITEITSEEQAEQLPFAARYLKCANDVQEICSSQPRFCAHCWIDRDDGVKPDMSQLDKPKGQVKWHPGWRQHQLQGRVLAFSVIEALQVAVTLYSEETMGGQPLADEHWHVTDYYENIRSKLKDLKEGNQCEKISEKLPKRICTTPMKAFTQYTPRANFHETALNSIVQATPDGYTPQNRKVALYEGPDMHNTCYDTPSDVVDVFAVVSGRRRTRHLEEVADYRTEAPSQIQPDSFSVIAENDENSTTGNLVEERQRQLQDIQPGKGWEVWGEPQGECDGTFNNACGRSKDNDCVLIGHHDGRGAIVGNEFSGWIVMNVPKVTNGLILIKIHTWHVDSESTLTQGWNSVNNEGRRSKRNIRRLENGQEIPVVEMTNTTNLSSMDFVDFERGLMRNYETPELPDSFKFEYSINGQITSLGKTEFLQAKKDLARIVEVMTLLDDETWTEPKDVQVAVRLTGCGRGCTFGVSHLYYS